MIIKAGDKASAEWRERKNTLKRGVVAKAKLATAKSDFALFKEEGIEYKDGVKTRAYIMYAAYLKWAELRGRIDPPPMSMRAFGYRVRELCPIKKGPGGIIFYMGVEPKADLEARESDVEGFLEGGVGNRRV